MGGAEDKLIQLVKDLPKEWKVVQVLSTLHLRDEASPQKSLKQQVSAKPSLQTNFKRDPLDEPSRGPNPTLLVTSVCCGPTPDPPKAKKNASPDPVASFPAAVCPVAPLDNVGGEMPTVAKELADIVSQHK